MPAELRSGQPDGIGLAIQAWNLLGGAIDWAGLPIVCDLLGIADPERLIHQLAAIRQHQKTE